MKACVVLNENMSKRLIAKGVAATSLVKNALAKGTVVITLGTTNAIVAEEILGRPIDRAAFAAGFIDDRWNSNARLGEVGEVVLREGKEVALDSQELLDSLGTGDLIIKGGNAIDPWDVVGVFTGAASGGTVGRYLPIALARGVDVVVPIGLAKTVHSSVTDLARELGIGKVDRCMGIPCGIFPLVGRVITEIDALETLFPVKVTQVANGGVGRGVGSVSLLITGEETAVEEAFDLVSSLQGEPGIVLEGRA